MKLFQQARKYGAQVATGAAGLVLSGLAAAQSTDPTTGVGAVTALRTEMGNYGPVMFGLAVVSVGVMIGVKWIKRARGAA